MFTSIGPIDGRRNSTNGGGRCSHGWSKSRCALVCANVDAVLPQRPDELQRHQAHVAIAIGRINS